ncbi:MAG: lamin tail domain-containing protein [Candidatus Paceibacterota bacterium]
MFKKLILFSVIVFLSSFGLAQAQIVINEVQLAPTGERFIELYNTGSSAVNLTDWYLQRKTATGSSFGSLVSKTNFEGKSIDAGGYFVISRAQLSSSDIVLDSLTLTESNTIQLKNSAEEIADKLGWGNAGDCDSPCPPNPLEGQSLQRTSSSIWISSAPTPGVTNETTTASSGGSGGGGETVSTSTSTTPTTQSGAQTVQPLKMRAKITTPALAFAGMPINIEGIAYGTTGEKLNYGKYFWNFGDGDSRQSDASYSAEKFTHIYFYPGEYVVSLEYYSNYYSQTPEAVDKVAIKVVAADVVISRVGDDKDFFVELTNNAGYDTDISNWVLASDSKSFAFPKNTVLGSKKKIIFSARVTGLSIADQASLKLKNSQGETVFDYPLSLTPAPAVSTRRSPPASTPPPRESIDVSLVSPATLEASAFENLAANPTISEAGEEATSNSYIPIIAFLVLVVGSAGGVYFIRRQRVALMPGDDFELLDE